MNVNYVTTMFPGAASYTPPGGYTVADVAGSGTSAQPSICGLRGYLPEHISWVVAGFHTWQQIPHYSQGGSGLFDNRGRLPNCPLGFFPKGDDTTVPGLRTGLRFRDPFMRTLRDLYRVTPFERYFGVGRLSESVRKHGEVQVWDGLDNNNDGRVDEMVATASWPGAPGYGGDADGHYVGDRRALGGVNLNEVAHPSGIWYTALGRTFDLWRGSSNGNDMVNFMVIVGKKPLKGYTSWVEGYTRSTTGHKATDSPVDNTTYQSSFWYENQYADGDAMHTNHEVSVGHVCHEISNSQRAVWVGNSPVHTLYITAQSLGQDEQPIAEVRLRATVERLPDGKLNILDCGWTDGQ
jgi:hypothetical protein